MTTRSTFGICFYCKKAKQNKNGLSPIELSININGKRVFINLPQKYNPIEFEKLFNSKRDNELKKYLQAITNKLYEIQRELLENNIPLTAEILRDYFKVGGVKTNNLDELYIEFFKHLKTTNVSSPTIRKYELVTEHFNKLIPSNTQLTNINPIQAKEFVSYMSNIYEQSTLSGHITKIKAIFQFAVNTGKLKTNPFINIKISKGTKEVEYLTEEEINKLLNVELPTESLERVRDLFIYQISTGQAYVDAQNTRKEDIRFTEDNTPYISKYREKTNIKYTTIILPFGFEVLKKYDYQLPKISNQKYNNYIKVVAHYADIDKNLHTHIARHTFATYCLNKGIRIEIVSKALGHTNLKQSQHYAKLIDNTIINEFKTKIL
jgi:site-specific recombinase XerD